MSTNGNNNLDYNYYKEDLDSIIENQIYDDIMISGKRKNNILYERELKNIKDKIENNREKIEQIKLDLIQLKNEKRQQQKDIINLLSKKESIEEVYKNQIFALNNNNEIKNNNKNIALLSITLEEFSKLDINKYTEQVTSMTDDILDKYIKNFNKKETNNNLKKIIFGSYEIFCKNALNTDVEVIINNFISKISLYISNQSFGKYSEENINIFLRYLININLINKEIEKIGKFVNKQYKDKKIELKNDIKNLETMNVLYLKLYKDGQNELEKIKYSEKDLELHLQNFHFNINDIKSNNSITENSYKGKNQNQNNKNIIVDKQIYINYNDLNKKIEKQKKKEKEKKNLIGINETDKLNNNNRVIKGKKIKREIIYHDNDILEYNQNSEENSFNKNINCISDDSDDENNNKDDNKLKNELINMNDSDLLILNEKKKINEKIIDSEISGNIINKRNNLNKQIYNKKYIKMNNVDIIDNNKIKINKKTKDKIKNIQIIEEDIKNGKEITDILEKNKILDDKKIIVNKNSGIKNNKETNIKNSKEKNKDKDVYKNNEINNKSLDILLKDYIKLENNKNDRSIKSKSSKIIKNISLLTELTEEKKIGKEKNQIYYNKKKKGVFNKSKKNTIRTQKISRTDFEEKLNLINNLTECKEQKSKQEKQDAINIKKNKIKINSNMLQNLIKAIKTNVLTINKNEENIKKVENVLYNVNNEDDKKDNMNIKINQNFNENINKLFNIKKNNTNVDLDGKNQRKKSETKNLNKYITKNEIIRNNINNNNEITLPISNRPISNRISKLNLNIFITQNKENVNRIPENISVEPNITVNRNQENKSNYYNNKTFKSDDINNDINNEEIIDPNEYLYTEEKDYLNNNNYKKLNLNKKIYEDTNRILINNQFFSSNNRQSKKGGKLIYISTKQKDAKNLYLEKKFNNHNSLFYNSHDFRINNTYTENSDRSKRKSIKSLMKNLSTSKNKSKKKKSNNPKYIDLSYLNRFNKILFKSNNSSTLNENNNYNSKNESILLNNTKRNLKDILIDNNKNRVRNKNKKNQMINFIGIKSETFNNTLNANINTISNYDNKTNKKIFVNKTKDLNKKNKNNKNDLKKLLEKKLLYSIPNNIKINFNPKKILAEGVMESFCYFKILDKDSPKCNPLDLCSINPESLGYSEGYISIDVILGQFRIIPKKIISKNLKSTDNNNVLTNSNGFSVAEYTLLNNGNNVFRFEIDKKEKQNCIRIDLKNLKEVKIKKQMKDIIKIHKIFLKYNSQTGFDSEEQDGKKKKKVLSINKLLYMKEISDINMEQNEKIKAALCNFFAFTIIFGNYKINKVECIFINFDLFNIWNKCLEIIAENNNKSKNSLISHREIFHRKQHSNNFNSISN